MRARVDARPAWLLALVLLAGSGTAHAKRFRGTLPFEEARTLVDSFLQARGIRERLAKGSTLTLAPKSAPATPPATSRPSLRSAALRTLYLYWEGGQLEVSALVRRGSITALKGLVSGCRGYEVAAALPLERKQWLFGIAPKGAPPALLLVARFSKPITRDAFVAHLATFERSARYLAGHVLTAVARSKRDGLCPKPRAWELPLEILTD